MRQPAGWLWEQERYDELEAMAMDRATFQQAMASDWEIPQVLDLTEILPLENQGREGSCQGQSSSSAAMMVHWLETGELVDFSADFSYYRAQFYDGLRGDVGSTLAGGAKSAIQDGYLLEQQMPYTDRYNPGDMPANWKQLAAEYRVGQFAQLRSYREIVEFQSRGFGAVWWGIRWAPQEGPAGEVRRGGIGRGGHATHLAGWGRRSERMQFDADGLPSWLWHKNSWARGKQDFSVNGWSKWHRSAIEFYLNDRYTVCMGITRMPHLTPRVINWEKSPVIRPKIF
jgi:hypothetical protein